MTKGIEEIRTELQDKLEENNLKLEAWIDVSYETKKDGKPFANISKNIKGAFYRKAAHTLQTEYELCVVYKTEKNGVQDDVIRCSELIKYMDAPAKLAKVQNYAPKQPYLEQVYNYDLDDIKQAVNARIEQLKCIIYDLKHELKLVEVAYNQFEEDIKAAYSNLIANTGAELYNTNYSRCRNALYYAIKKNVLKNIDL